MRRGEIWRVRLATSSGHAQTGERPTVIVQNNSATSNLSTVLQVPFTSRLAAQRFPATILVNPDKNNGLTVPSVALVYQASAQDKRNFVEQLGVLDEASLQRITDQIMWIMTN